MIVLLMFHYYYFNFLNFSHILHSYCLTDETLTIHKATLLATIVVTLSNILQRTENCSILGNMLLIFWQQVASCMKTFTLF